MKKLDVRLLRQIRDTKGQFISITVMIVIALTIFISMNMVGNNLVVSLDTYYEITNFPDLFIEVVRMPQSAVLELEGIPGVAKAQGRVSQDVLFRVEDPEEKVRIRLVSLPPGEETLSSNFAIQGDAYPTGLQSAVVLAQFADARGIKPGDTITPVLSGRERSLQVTGIVGNPEYIYLMESETNLLPDPAGFGVIYVSEEFAQSSLGFQGSYNQVVIQLEPGSQLRLDDIIEDVEDALEPYGLIRLIKRENQLSNNIMGQEIAQLDSMSKSITILFLGVAAVIIYIMLSRIVRNDRMSIGVMKALGYSDFEILFHYLKYALAMGVVGSLLGIAGSIPVSAAFTNLYVMYLNIPVLRMELYYIYFYIGFFLIIGFCGLAGYFGSRQILQIMPSDSMRPEAPAVGGRIFLEKISVLWKRFSFSWKMIFRNILRNKKRAAILVAGIALTYGITMVPLYMSTIWTNVFTIQFGFFQTMDYSVNFSRPMNENAVLEVRQLVDATHVEPKIEIPFELQNGWRKKSAIIIGIQPETRFFHFREPVTHRQLFLQEEGLIISERLARDLDVKVGDTLVLKNYLPGKEDIPLQVTGITEQYLGNNGFVNLRFFDSSMKEEGLITGVYLDSEDQVPRKLQNLSGVAKVESNREMMDTFMEFADLVIYSVLVMMVFGAILGFAIVYNVTIINISERTMEISSLRVLGFDKKDVYHMITRENAIMTILGILLGIPVGRAMCAGIISTVSEELMTIPLLITPSSYLYTALATIVFVVVAQLATMRKIYSIDFMDALKNRTS